MCRFVFLNGPHLFVNFDYLNYVATFVRRFLAEHRTNICKNKFPTISTHTINETTVDAPIIFSKNNFTRKVCVYQPQL